MALICIDFDYTVANGHTHNDICEAISDSKAKDHTGITDSVKLKEAMESQWSIIKDIKPVGKAATWAAMLEILLRDGHSIAITSFNEFGHIIPRYLKEVIGLSDELVKKINVVAFLPDDQSDKNAHIARAIEEAKLQGINKKEVILIDDSNSNCQGAKRMGYTAVLAKPDLGNHIPQMLTAAIHADYVSGKIYEGRGMFKPTTSEPEPYKPHPHPELKADMKQQSSSP